jgi:hypothetical protein
MHLEAGFVAEITASLRDLHRLQIIIMPQRPHTPSFEMKNGIAVKRACIVVAEWIKACVLCSARPHTSD